MNTSKTVNPNRRIIVVSSLRLHKDGIAFYTSSLFSPILASANHEIYVIGNKGSEVGEHVGKIIPIWSRNNLPSLFEVHRVIRSIDPAIIHLQFHVGLYGDIKVSVLFLLSILLWRLLGKKIVVTYHSVRDYRHETGFVSHLKRGLVGFVYNLPNKIVLSSELLKRFLVEFYQIESEKIFVVPMGVPELGPWLEKDSVREGVTGIISPAFLRPGLMLEELILSLGVLKERYALLLYLIASGLVSADGKKVSYLSLLRDTVERLDLTGEVIFVEDSEIDTDEKYYRVINRSTVLVYLHEAYDSVDAGSISIMNAVVLGKAMIVSDVPKFYLIVDLFRKNGLSRLVIPNIENKQERVLAISEALEFALDRNVQVKVTQLLEELSGQMTWAKSAAMLASFYVNLLSA